MSEQAIYDRELAAYQQEYRDLAEAALSACESVLVDLREDVANLNTDFSVRLQSPIDQPTIDRYLRTLTAILGTIRLWEQVAAQYQSQLERNTQP